MVNLKEIIKICRENDIKNYSNKAQLTNTDIGKRMIVYSTKTLHSRDIDNFGKEEDEDLFIGLDEQGWIMYLQTIQFGAGDTKIILEKTESMKDEDVYNYLTGNSCSNKEFLMFMSTANNAY